MSTAWFCPACQKYHAPHVQTCPGGSPSLFPVSIPFHPKPGISLKSSCTKCGMIFDGPMGYVCPNVDCPTQARSTCTTAVISGTKTVTGVAVS